tara:strand:+ start:205 stop:810 length:606 start_codon:yes stop_codon:yes gene_type:complete
MKKLLLILLTFLIFGCTNSLNWQQSEEYSLLQVKESIENNDLYLFEKHFDIERVSEKLCDEIINYTKEKALKEINANDPFEKFGNNLAFGIIEIVKPIITTIISKNISEAVEMGHINKLKDNEYSSILYDFSFLLENQITFTILDLLNTKKRSFKINKSTTEFKINLTKNGESYEIGIILRKFEDYWRVTEIKNITPLLYN